MHKTRDLIIIAVIYLLAFVAGIISCLQITNIILKLFVFDVVATVVTFVFSCIFKNSSVYDAYWSLTPMVMSVWLFIYSKSFGIWSILFLLLFNLWGLRLTLNWVEVFTDFSYEDWRYRKYRSETPRIFWPIVNFFGIHMMPTLVVFLGMLPLFSIVQGHVGPLSILGFIVILFGISLEFFADRDMHEFINKAAKDTTLRGKVCRNGLWKHSRHPNYLGEITFWLGVFLSMLPYDFAHWYYVVGFLCIALLFNVVSIPLMEKRQLQRRPDYAQYRKETSRLLLK